jgi:predicted SAM-dependent methyltransferase
MPRERGRRRPAWLGIVNVLPVPQSETVEPDPLAAQLPRLHIGCGSTVVSGWVNIDKSPNVLLTRLPKLRGLLGRLRVLRPDQMAAAFPPGIVRADVRRGLDYPDDSVAFIYSSHLIEHMARWQAVRFARECRRVLRPGGALRLATPDLASLVRAYQEGDVPDGEPPADWFMRNMWTFREHDENWVQRTVRRLVTAPHQWVYDETSLRIVLEEAGFSSVTACTYRSGAMPDLEQLEHRPDSLFMEAIAS